MGGVQNVGVQVVKTNVEQTSKIERSFIEVTKRLRTYFTRVNHAYFYPPETNVHEISDILNDDAISTFINTMIFDIGVQSYSNINRIINFHIDMTQQNHNNKVKPDKLLLDEVNKKHLQTNNDDETSSTEAAMNLQPVTLPDAECNELRNVVAGLLELQLTGDSHEVMTRKNIDTNMSTDNGGTNYDDEPDFSVVEKQHIDDSSISSNSSGESSYNPDDETSDSEIDEELENKFYSIDDMLNRRILDAPNQDIFNVQNFITKVQIELLLEFGRLRSFDSKPNKRKEKVLSTVHQQDVRTQAIRFANNLIQQGDVAIISSSDDNPILEDSRSFDGTLNNLIFDQGWGRRNNRSESTLYGETYITRYKNRLFEFYEQGRKDSSKKMNAAMMRAQLQQENPNIFSIPGETEIKKHISKLFSQTKNGSKDNEHEENSDLDNNDEEVVNIDESEWKQVLVNITMQHTEAKPDYIYKEFLRVMREERGKNDDDLPSKQKVKGKISYTRASLKKKLKRSIV